jgi:beta-lactamase class A
VHDLDTGISASYRAAQDWYLASTVKVPVAIAVLRGVEAGLYTLDTPLTLRASDYVDGAGATNQHPVGRPLSIRFLLEQMIIHSDNTASDMLIDLIGLAEVNAVAESLVPQGGLDRITTLADVRRRVYGLLTSRAERLSGQDLILLKRQRHDTDRLLLLSQLTGVPVARFKLPTLDAAYRAYYASGVNSGPLTAYGELLAQLVQGRALSPASTDYLLTLMERVVTGPHRIKAGLPPQARFAHKTGTQRRRTCDAGIVTVPRLGQPPQRVIVAACTRDERTLADAERALREVGAALCRSGLITGGIPDAPSCHAAVLRAPSLPAVDALPLR